MFKNINRNPVNQFIYYSIGILAVVIVIMIVFYRMRFFNFEDVGNLGSLSQGTLGVVVSVAGSIVAIILANQAYIVAKQTEQRETVDKVVETIEGAVKPFLSMAVELRACFDVERLFMERWKPIIDEKIRQLKGTTIYDPENDSLSLGIFFKVLAKQKVDSDKVAFQFNDQPAKVQQIQQVVELILSDFDMSTYFELRKKLNEHIEKLLCSIDEIGKNPTSLLIWGLAYKTWKPSKIAGDLREGLYSVYIHEDDPQYPDLIFRPLLTAGKHPDEGSKTLAALGSEFIEPDLNNYQNKGLAYLGMLLDCFPATFQVDEVVDKLIDKLEVEEGKKDNKNDFKELILKDPRIVAIKEVTKEDLFGDELLGELKSHLKSISPKKYC